MAAAHPVTALTGYVDTARQVPRPAGSASGHSASFFLSLLRKKNLLILILLQILIMVENKVNFNGAEEASAAVQDSACGAEIRVFLAIMKLIAFVLDLVSPI